MAKQKTKIACWRRLFGWLRRHKISAVFATLFVVLALYLGGSWVVLQVQIHFERERFNSTQIRLNDIYNTFITKLGDPSLSMLKRNCEYTSIEIGQGALSCVINTYFNYANVSSRESANSYVKTIQGIIQNSNEVREYKHVSLEDLYLNSDSTQLASDSFKFIGSNLSCGTDYWFSNDHTLDKDLPVVFKALHGFTAQLNCSGSAKAEYFPVESD